jgi:hypothetical protein
MTPEVVSELATIADILWAIFYVVLFIAVAAVLRAGWSICSEPGMAAEWARGWRKTQGLDCGEQEGDDHG